MVAIRNHCKLKIFPVTVGSRCVQDLMKAIIENWLASSKFSLAINHPSSSDLCNKAESATQQRPDDRSNSCRLTGRFDADGGSNCSGNIRGVSCAGWVGCHRGITRQDFRSISSIGFELFLCVPVLFFFFFVIFNRYYK